MVNSHFTCECALELNEVRSVQAPSVCCRLRVRRLLLHGVLLPDPLDVLQKHMLVGCQGDTSPAFCARSWPDQSSSSTPLQHTVLSHNTRGNTLSNAQLLELATTGRKMQQGSYAKESAATQCNAACDPVALLSTTQQQSSCLRLQPSNLPATFLHLQRMTSLEDLELRFDPRQAMEFSLSGFFPSCGLLAARLTAFELRTTRSFDFMHFK